MPAKINTAKQVWDCLFVLNAMPISVAIFMDNYLAGNADEEVDHSICVRFLHRFGK